MLLQRRQQNKIPDMVVKMPGNQKVIVDAKAVMGAYVAAQETQDDTERMAAGTEKLPGSILGEFETAKLTFAAGDE